VRLYRVLATDQPARYQGGLNRARNSLRDMLRWLGREDEMITIELPEGSREDQAPQAG